MRRFIAALVLFGLAVPAFAQSITPVVTKGGQLVVFQAAPATPPTGDTYPFAPIIAVSSAPTVRVNGAAVALAGPAWYGAKDTPFVGYSIPPVKPGDAVEYDAPAGWVTSTAGPAPAATAAPILNSVGKDESAVPFTWLADVPRMPVGVNAGSQPTTAAVTTQFAANLVPVQPEWTLSTGGQAGKDARGYPLPWAAGAALARWVYGPMAPNPLDTAGIPSAGGEWTLSVADPTNGTPAAKRYWLTGANATVLSTTADGARATTIYRIAATPGGNRTLNVTLHVSGPPADDGLVHWTATDLRVIPPDPATGKAQPVDPDPLAPSVGFAAAVKGMGAVRFMDSHLGWGGDSNQILPHEVIDPAASAWVLPQGPHLRATRARYLNTDPASTSYAWSSPRVCGVQGPFRSLGQADPPAQVTAIATAGSTKLTGLSAPTFVGSTVSGPGVPDGAYLAGVGLSVGDPAVSVLSAPATQSGQVTLSVAAPKWLPLSAADRGRALAADGGSGTLILELGFNAPHGLVSGRYCQTWVETTGATVPVTNAAPYKPSDGLHGGYVWPTGPTTIAIAAQIGGVKAGVPNVPQAIDSATEIDLTAGGTLPGWMIYWTQPGGSVPVEATAAAVSRTPGVALWHNIPLQASPELVAEEARRIARYLATTDNPIALELGNELWDTGTARPRIPMAIGKLIGYLPAGMPFGKYTTEGVSIGGQVYSTVTPMADHLYQAFEDAAAGAGVDRSRIRRYHGSFFGWAGVSTSVIAQAAKKSGIRVDGIAVAPYLDHPADPTIVAACKSWPVPAIIDLYRHWTLYNRTSWGLWQQHRAAAGGIPLVTYEGALESIIPASVPGRRALQHDCMSHPLWADAVRAWLLQCQRGGASLAMYFSLHPWGGNYDALWGLTAGNGQPPGDGSDSLYATAQGGAPGDGKDHMDVNKAVGLQGYRRWVDALVPPAPPPPPPPPAPMPAPSGLWYYRLAAVPDFRFDPGKAVDPASIAIAAADEATGAAIEGTTGYAAPYATFTPSVGFIPGRPVRMTVRAAAPDGTAMAPGSILITTPGIVIGPQATTDRH